MSQIGTSPNKQIRAIWEMSHIFHYLRTDKVYIPLEERSLNIVRIGHAKSKND